MFCKRINYRFSSKSSWAGWLRFGRLQQVTFGLVTVTFFFESSNDRIKLGRILHHDQIYVIIFMNILLNQREDRAKIKNKIQTAIQYNTNYTKF